ncbi:DUF2846 domain-containing protein [Belliella aquatica]|uniref:DUF2846 domain-containing protein n=1 Tax=Belliella aquatica TaxID=1323734 RepID=A0ABQ1LIC7_9BACT|nr:DUF2846 domain-containing protein [Belliella aquatica]MCH7404057.1 DUF2846 domain-containing protein [Belliella aquatica]GGC24994.1 hypothetical protein GCM10010993_00080 [Belliella aquatica]
MKKTLCLFALLFAIQFQIQAQSEKATVYLLRPDGLDDFVPYYTYFNQKLISKLGEGKYSTHQIDPGFYEIHTQYRGKIKSDPETVLSLNLEAGQTYYITLTTKTKAFGKGKFYCIQVSEKEAKELIGSSGK